MLMSSRSLATMTAAILAAVVAALAWQNLVLRDELAQARAKADGQNACPAPSAPIPALCPAPSGATAEGRSNAGPAGEGGAQKALSFEDALKARLAEQQSPGMQLSPFGTAAPPTAAGR